MGQSDEDVFHARIQRRRDRRRMHMIIAVVSIGTLAFLVVLSGMR